MKKVITTEKIPVKMWLDDIEDGALKQAQNLANLPFAFKHIALMADCHQGYGMPIGGVMATDGVIVPNAVGVDIGCFTENTKVKLTDNRELTFKELIEEDLMGKTNYCYAKDTVGNIIITKIIKPRKTREVTKLVKIILDNDEEINCTEDHIFYTLDQQEIKAKNLMVETSLFPLYIEKASNVQKEKLSHHPDVKDHLVVFNPRTKLYDFVHYLADDYNIKNGSYSSIPKSVRHHINFDKYDNDPSNVIRVPWKKHWEIHAEAIGELNKKGKTGWKVSWKNNREKFSKYSSEKMTKLQKDPDYQEKRNKAATITIKEFNKTEKFKEITKDAGQRGKQYLVKYSKSEKGRLKSSEVGNRKLQCPECQTIVKGPFGALWHIRKCHKGLPLRVKDFIRIQNHSIKSILFNEIEPTEVYCLTTEYGNFALASGVFVHNCGVSVVKTNLKELPIDARKDIMSKIRELTPLGFDHHKENQAWEGFDRAPDIQIIQQEINSAKKQLGTLGGGNHFLQLSSDSDGFISLMLHSGSRNFGYRIADVYHKKAQKLCERWYSDIPDKDLAFLPMETPEAKEYFEAMNYALEFAKENRSRMLTVMVNAVKSNFPEVTFDPVLNIHHNYAAWENHFGQNVIVHRKGATSARNGQLGIIPGSQGTKSYIVKGKGNPDSFMSSSHGAGRAMGRGVAQRNLNLGSEIKLLEDQGIIHSIRSQKDLDEASSAYKDIKIVMANQADLVDIVVELSPLAVIKG